MINGMMKNMACVEKNKNELPEEETEDEDLKAIHSRDKVFSESELLKVLNA